MSFIYFVNGVGVNVVRKAGCIELFESVPDFFFACKLQEVFKFVPLVIGFINGTLLFLYGSFSRLTVHPFFRYEIAFEIGRIITHTVISPTSEFTITSLKLTLRMVICQSHF